MPTSSYMPSVTVEIAWNAGQRTPVASYTWTDVSDYVELDRGFTVTWGRGDERSTADANQLGGLVLDNRDGRFTQGLASSPYYPNVKPNRPIRVRVDPVDGAQVTYFQGFINEWPLDWSDGTDATAYATISATSRLARLGTQAQLKSIVETAILADAPIAYYTLGEPEGSTQANDSSGNRADPLVLAGDPLRPLVFGSATGPGTDGLTAAQFVGGQFLSGPPGSLASPSSVECFMSRTGAPATPEAFMFAFGAVIYMTATGGLAVSAGSLGTPELTSAASIADGATHHVALTVSSGGLWSLYVDGSSVATASPGSSLSGTLTVGGSPYTGLEVNWTGLGRLTGAVAHAAYYSTELSAARVLAHAQAGLTGYAGETTSARLIRYAGYAAIPTAEINAETGQTTVQHVDTTGQQVVELMRLMETTEGGVLYDERDGTLTFHNRAHRLTVASAYTLNMAEQEVEAGYAPRVDLTGLANDISTQDISGRYTAHVFDATSILDNGSATLSIETASEDDDEPLNLAAWSLLVNKDPRERAPQLEVDALAQVGKTPNCSAVLATTVGTKVTVSNRPTQASSSSVDYFVEGGTAVFGPESLHLTFNVSPTSPWDQTLILGDAVRGAIGVYPIAL